MQPRAAVLVTKGHVTMGREARFHAGGAAFRGGGGAVVRRPLPHGSACARSRRRASRAYIYYILILYILYYDCKYCRMAARGHELDERLAPYI
jgi:hypothetical protein